MAWSRWRVFLTLALFLAALAWGTETCLHHLNRYLDPPQPIRAVEWRRLDDELLRCRVLGVDLLVAWPRAFPVWSPPVEPLPAKPDGHPVPFRH